MFRVVSSRDTNEVEVVSARWWAQNQGQGSRPRPLGLVWWPPSGSSLDKYLQQHVEPDYGTWRHYPARSLHATGEQMYLM